jgi:hypothetical protein
MDSDNNLISILIASRNQNLQRSMDSRLYPRQIPREFWTSPRLVFLLPGRVSLHLNEEGTLPIMSTRFHFSYRIDMWSIDGGKVIEHLAGVEDFQVAMATYRAACERWPGRTITLSQGARVIESPVRLREEA